MGFPESRLKQILAWREFIREEALSGSTLVCGKGEKKQDQAEEEVGLRNGHNKQSSEFMEMALPSCFELRKRIKWRKRGVFETTCN